MRKFPSAKDLGRITKPGRYAVGHGAYLQISQWGTKAWLFRYRHGGKARHLGLGSCEYVTLVEAREKAHALRRAMVLDGVDPLQAKREAKRAHVHALRAARTFKECALDYIAAHEDGWRGTSSRRQWIESMTRHVFPKLGDTPIASVDVAAVLSVLDPIARTIPETASRVKNRIAAVLDWASARDLRPHDNPAKRANLLPKRRKQPKHFAAMPYGEIAAFMQALRRQPEMSARALEFLILTAARPGEVLGAKWAEIEGDVWTIPGERMKGGRPHRVPLSAPAQRLLADLPREGEFLFLGRRTGGRPHPMVMVTLLQRMGHAVTAHGFRSSFRDWAAETTAFPNHVVEMALAHAVGSGVEAAYRRGDLFEKRRQLMQHWAAFCEQPARPATVVPLHVSRGSD